MSIHTSIAAESAAFAPARAGRASRRYAAFKRALDLAIALPALLFISPLLGALALLVKWDSNGPALFRQTRIGEGGKPFEILKFRSMHVLENGTHVAQATKNDPRVTRIGRFLRQSSLDELPQLINIVKGEMSLVGPRPHAAAHDAYFAPRIPFYARRHSVKPGLTGWAQVNGLRGETPTLDLMRRRAEADVWYAANANIALDVAILLRTPREILKSRNAY